jgi:hypothetical protein
LEEKMAARNGITVMMDRARVMKFTMNSLALAEDLTGLNILSLDLQKISMKGMRAIIFAALLNDDDDLTLQKAGDLADSYEGGLAELMEFAGIAIQEAFGTAEKNAKTQRKAKPLQ